MSKPAVSVIIPAYNVEQYIRQGMDSVLKQTLREIEVICVNDGSTDRTLEILKEYEASDSRVKVLTQKNSGAGAARNNGLKLAQGETLSFLDADDFYELNMLEKAYRKLRETKAQFVVFDSDEYMNDTGEYRTPRHIDKNAIPPYEPFHRRALTNNPFRAFIGWAWDKLYDAEFVRENGFRFQEQRTTNDMAFVFSALIQGERIAVIPQVLAHHRKNVASSLSNTREESWMCFYNALCEVKRFMRERGAYPEMSRDFINYALHSCLWNLMTLQGAAKEKLYAKLKTEWLDELELTGKKEDYFDQKNDYQELLRIQHLDIREYKEYNK